MKLLLASALALVVLAAPGRAQSSLALAAPPAVLPTADEMVAPPARITPRLVSAIGSPSATARADALHRVVTLAHSADGADLRPAVGALLSVLRTDADARHRLLALRALETSADEDVRSALRSVAGRETHPAVQRLLFAVLVEHYGVDALRSDANVAALVRSIRAHSGW